MRVTRRTLVRMATALATTGAAAVESVAAAQTQTPSTPAESPSPTDDLAAVRAQLQRNAQQLAQVKLPIETEPAFHFKA
jgi:hypothetical protein